MLVRCGNWGAFIIFGNAVLYSTYSTYQRGVTRERAEDACGVRKRSHIKHSCAEDAKYLFAYN